MESRFLCPHCDGEINHKGNLLFSVQNISGRRALLVLSTKLGDYEVKNRLPFRFDMGDRFDFFCPLCGHELSCEKESNLVRVLMNDESGHQYEVCFSRITGEQSTYKITGKNVEVYGLHSQKYLDIMNFNDVNKP